MKMDFSKFKKTKEDAHSTMLQSPEGHSIHIAHAPLSESFRSQLKKLPLQKAKGGMVSNYDDGGQVSDDSSGDQSSPSQQAPVIVNVGTPNTQRDPASMNDMLQRVSQWLPGAPPPRTDQAVPNSTPTPQANAAPAMPPPVGGPGPAAVNAPQRRAAAPPAADPYSTAARAEQSAIQTGIQGEKEKANAIGAEGTQEAAAYQGQQERLQNFQDQYQQNYQNLENERQSFVQDMQDDHIDPEHYWTNHSKTSTAIGLILGGIGSGLTGGPNMAQQLLEHMKDQDLRSQEANLGKKKSLLDANLRQFGNLHEATMATRVMQNDMLVSKINQIASQNANPKAQAQAKIAIAPLLQQSAQLQQQLALRKTLTGNQGDQIDPARRLEALKVNKFIDDKQYEQGNKELSVAEKTQAAHQAADEAIDGIVKEQTLGNRVLNPIQSAQQIKALRARLVPLIMDSSPSKRLTEESLNSEIDPFIPRFSTGKITSEQMRHGLHSVISTHADRTPTLDGLGVSVPKYQPSAPVKTMGGVQYKKVPGGWQKVQ